MTGRDLRRLRKTFHLTQHALALKVGLKHAAISQWEMDKTRPDRQMEKKLSHIFGTKVQMDPIERAPAQRVEGLTESDSKMDLSKDVYIEIMGKVRATPFRFSIEHGLGRFIKGKPGEQGCFALEVEGDSMVPIYMPGDLIICSPHSAVLHPYAQDADEAVFVPYDRMIRYNNRDVIVTFNGETNLKRLHIEKTQGPRYDIYMVSVNAKYQRIKVRFGDEWALQALVIRKENPPLSDDV